MAYRYPVRAKGSTGQSEFDPFRQAIERLERLDGRSKDQAQGFEAELLGSPGKLGVGWPGAGFLRCERKTSGLMFDKHHSGVS